MFFGLFVGLGIMFSWAFVVAHFFRIFITKEVNEVILVICFFGPLYFLWYNGNISWVDYGELSLENVFFSLYMHPLEIVNGIENVLKLETGTLGGWPL